MAKTNSTGKQTKKSEGCHCGEPKAEKTTKSRAKSSSVSDCKNCK